MRLYFYSNGESCGFYKDGKSLVADKGKGFLRPAKRYIDGDEKEIPSGWKRCTDDRSAIEKIILANKSLFSKI